MASIAWTNFRGIRPLATPENDVSGTAVLAHNVDLRGHRLETWRTPCRVAEAVADAVFLQRVGGCWFSSPKCITLARRGPECGVSAILCGDGWPRLATWSTDCKMTSVVLAIPTPGTTPVVTVGVNGYSETSDPRAYAYAYTRDGEHGSLSPPSPDLLVKDAAEITISNLAPPPFGHGIDGIAVYRRMAGFITGRENVEEHVTRWVLVRTIDESGGSFVDNTLAMYVLGEGLDTPVVYSPPDDLQGVRALQNVPGFVGFNGTYIAFSEGRLAHSWPLRFRFNLGVPVRSVQEVDGLIYAITDTTPFVFNIANGIEKGVVPKELSDWKLGLLPGVGERGIVKWNGSVVYLSKDGLVRLTRQGPELMTDKWFTPAQWRRLRIDTMVLGASREFLFLVSRLITYVWQLDAADQAHMELTTTSWTPQVLTMQGDEVYGANNGAVEQWNAGDTKYAGRWRSSDLRAPVGSNFTSIEVKAEHATKVGVFADSVLIDELVVDTAPERLARYDRGTMRHAIELSGQNLSVGAVYLAPTHRDQFGGARNG